MTELSPFEVHVDDAVLADLRERLLDTRWPGGIDGAGWHYGAPQDEVRRLCDAWVEFDWRSAEAKINAFPQFLTEIDGEQVHFLHVRSEHPDALPLLLTHGWPGSIAEFLDVIGPLVDPPAHGGDAADAFHVIAPSIPGYGFSGPTRTQGVHIRRVAEMWAELMARLGYDGYVAQGGDWGALITTHLALVDADHVARIHLNMVVAPPEEDQLADLTDDEQVRLGEMLTWQERETGYSSIHRTRPQTLSYGLTDSPAGLAGWIYEKFRVWSDVREPTGTPFTDEQLLTNLTIYWATGTILSSTRLYFEVNEAGMWGGAGERVEVPTGGAIFRKEIMRPSRRWAERAYEIVHWSEFDRGGHFAAMEVPDLWLPDVRECFRAVR